MFELFDSFVWNFIITIGLLLIVLLLVEYIVRKAFKLKRERFFTKSYVNDIHKRWEKIFQRVFFVFLFLGLIVNISLPADEPFLFFQPFFLLFVFIFATGVLEIVMAKKYGENPNLYIALLIELLCFALILTAFFLYVFFKG